MGQKARIVVVDDEQTICEFSQAILERTGKFDVRTFTDSEKGWESIKSEPPDLLLLDVDMPGLDGGDLAKRLESLPTTRAVSVVFLTALIRKEEEAEQERIQRHYFLAKPISANELIERIEIILGDRV